MKQLQESLLDDEDVLLKDTHKAAEILKSLKLINKIDNSSYPRDNCDDAFGRKLNRGDIVIYADVAECVSFFIVHSVDEETGECLLVYDKDDFYKDEPDTAESILCEVLIKIDLKILEQIMKVK